MIHISKTAAFSATLLLLLFSCTPHPSNSYLPQLPEPSVDQKTDDGFYVKVFKDGSARVSRSNDLLADNWSIDCRVDQMNDRRECSISSELGGPFVSYGHSSSPEFVCIFGHDFPGETGKIRIDGNTAVSTDDEGCVPASRVLSQMKSGKVFLSRWMEWPYDYYRDSQVSLDGFNKAMEVVNQIRSGNI